MASTALADIVDRSQIAAYVAATFPDRLPFVQYGAATFDSASMAANGGHFLTIPSFVFDSVAAEVNDGSASTPGKISTQADVAAICHRKRVRAVDDAVKAALGRNEANAVNDEIARQSAEYWAKQVNVSLIKVLTALFDGSAGVLRTTHLNDDSVGSGDAVGASYNAVIDTITLHGDNLTDIAVMVAHPAVYGNLQKEAGSKASFMAFGDTMIPVYAGIPVVLSNSVATSGSGTYKKYDTYFVRAGALYVAWQRELNTYAGVELLYPRDVISQVADYAVHVHGCKWNTTTQNPADSDLATATNYAKTASDDRLIGVTVLRTNAF